MRRLRASPYRSRSVSSRIRSNAWPAKPVFSLNRRTPSSYRRAIASRSASKTGLATEKLRGTVARWRAPTSSAIESPVICPTMSSRAVSSAALASGQPTTTAPAVARCFSTWTGSAPTRCGRRCTWSAPAFPSTVPVNTGHGDASPQPVSPPSVVTLEEDAPDPGDVPAPVGMNGPHRDVHDMDPERFDCLPLHFPLRWPGESRVPAGTPRGRCHRQSMALTSLPSTRDRTRTLSRRPDCRSAAGWMQRTPTIPSRRRVSQVMPDCAASIRPADRRLRGWLVRRRVVPPQGAVPDAMRCGRAQPESASGNNDLPCRNGLNARPFRTTITRRGAPLREGVPTRCLYRRPAARRGRHDHASASTARDQRP